MRKLIHSKFELDLSGFELSDNEENNWFSDSFFSKYSFPFEIDVEKDIDIASGFISTLNPSNLDTYFEVKYVHANKIENAIFEIESFQNKLSCVVRYGFEQLPSFEKNLSELSLEKFDLQAGESIYQHAQNIITKTWPDVNYNFPQIHTDKYDGDDGMFNGFLGIINNRVNGEFLQNSVDSDADLSNNLNIMQPFPYLIYVLQTIMSDSGYVLKGDILSDERLKNTILINTSDYYTTKIFDDLAIVKGKDDYTPYDGELLGLYETVMYLQPGKYELFGTVLATFGGLTRPGLVRVYFNGAQIFNELVFGTNKSIDISLILDNPVGQKELKIVCISNITAKFDIKVFDLNLSRIFDYDSNGNPIPTIINENKIDLPKSTPKILVQDLIKAVKNWFNYDLDIIGKDAIMNRIESKLNYSDALDLQDTEVRYPLKKNQAGISFLLKFQDIENEKFKYKQIYQSRQGVLTENFTVNEKTTTIEINGLPLPLLNRNGVTTAYSFEDNDSKVYLVTYDGLVSGNNVCRSESSLLLPEVHLAYWIKWFQFRIKAIPFTWSFKKWIEDIYDLRPKTKIFAYNKYHIIKTINKTEVKPDLFDIEIETESLE